MGGGGGLQADLFYMSDCMLIRYIYRKITVSRVDMINIIIRNTIRTSIKNKTTNNALRTALIPLKCITIGGMK